MLLHLCCVLQQNPMANAFKKKLEPNLKGVLWGSPVVRGEYQRFKPASGHKSANQAVIGSSLPARAAKVKTATGRR